MNALRKMADFDDVSDKAKEQGVTQRDFLLAVQGALDLTRIGIARRLCCSEITVNKWLDTPGGKNWRHMPATVWKHLGDLMRYHLAVSTQMRK